MVLKKNSKKTGIKLTICQIVCAFILKVKYGKKIR